MKTVLNNNKYRLVNCIGYHGLSPTCPDWSSHFGMNSNQQHRKHCQHLQGSKGLPTTTNSQSTCRSLYLGSRHFGEEDHLGDIPPLPFLPESGNVEALTPVQSVPSVEVVNLDALTSKRRIDRDTDFSCSNGLASQKLCTATNNRLSIISMMSGRFMGSAQVACIPRYPGPSKRSIELKHSGPAMIHGDSMKWTKRSEILELTTTSWGMLQRAQQWEMRREGTQKGEIMWNNALPY